MVWACCLGNQTKSSWNAVFGSCGKVNHWQGARELLQEMAHKLLTPDVVGFSAATSACEKGKQCEGALGLL